MIKIDCPQCGKPFSVGDEFAGLAIPCPFCKRELAVSRPTDAAPAPAGYPEVIIVERNAPLPAAERTMTHGDSSGVVSVAISADGRRALSAGKDRNVRLWDLDSGAELRTLGEHYKPLQSVIFPGDGRLAAAMDEGYLCVHDCETGRLVFEEYGSMQQMCATADGRFLFVATENGASIYDLEKRFCIDRLGDPHETHEGNVVRAIACSPDGSQVLTAGFYEAKLWKIDTFKMANSLKAGHWRGETAKAIHCFDGPEMLSVARIAFLSGTETAVFHGHARYPYSSDLAARKVNGIFSLKEFPNVRWNSFAVSANGRRMAILHQQTDKAAVSVIESPGGKVVRAFEGIDLASVALSADGSRIVIGAGDGKLRCWSV